MNLIIGNSTIKLLEYKNKFLIYNIDSNEIKKINIADGRIIESYIEKYKLNTLSITDRKKFEDFIDSNFNTNYVKPKFRFESLNDTKTISRLEILLTTYCNMNCKYCYANGGNYGLEKQNYSIKNLESDLNKLIPNIFNDIKLVMFFGGEPMVNIEGIEFVCDFFKSLLKKGVINKLPYYTLVTNGTLINSESIKILKENNIQVTVSIDGDELIHNTLRTYRNGIGTYRNVHEGIESLIQNGVNLSMLEVTYTSLHQKMGYTRNSLKNMLKNKFQDIEILIVDCTGDTEYAIKKEDLKNDLEIKNSKAFDLSIRRMLKNNKRKDYFCNAGLNSFILTQNGNIYPCHKFINKDEYMLGNIRDSEIFRSEDFYHNTKKINNLKRSQVKECSECWAKNLCVICPDQLISNKNNKTVFVEECENMRHNIIKCLGNL